MLIVMRCSPRQLVGYNDARTTAGSSESESSPTPKLLSLNDMDMGRKIHIKLLCQRLNVLRTDTAVI